MEKSREEMLTHVQQYIETDDVLHTNTLLILYLLENCEITVPEEKRYFVRVNCEGITTHIIEKRATAMLDAIRNSYLGKGEEALFYTGMYDFGHTTTEWKSVITLGIYGLRNRILEYADKCPNDQEKQRFYNHLLMVYDGILSFMKRAAEKANLCRKTEMAESILRLTESKPRTLFEALQTSIIYYTVQQMFDGTVLRTMGRLDSLLYPYYAQESKENARKMLEDYTHEINSFCSTANIPYALGGTDVSGNSLVNPLSYELLDVYQKANIADTKLHLLCSHNMPEALIQKALDGVTEGNNSIAFMSDEKIIEGLIKLKETKEDATDYHVVGCYECGGNGELTCSCNARINLPKALELTLNHGVDMLTGEKIGIDTKRKADSFDALLDSFYEQIAYASDCAMKITDFYEKEYKNLHASPVLSGTYTSALESGKDLYASYGAKYNNSSINAIGLATVVDSLAAIRKLVYEEKQFTLKEFVSILKSDWEDREPLRRLIKNKYPKFGTGDQKTDDLAKRIVAELAKYISGKPNAKGGVYRLGLFSINWRWELGAKTAASADGRRSSETLSQNASAVFGADKEGATAHLLSVAAIDASDTPNGTVADIDMHISAVKGENGKKAFWAALKTYLEAGGFAVHFNVLDTEKLKDAQRYPEKYPNLQVRLCGWNVLFSALSKEEQDEFIERSMR